jgi:hypothetical protein
MLFNFNPKTVKIKTRTKVIKKKKKGSGRIVLGFKSPVRLSLPRFYILTLIPSLPSYALSKSQASVRSTCDLLRRCCPLKVSLSFSLSLSHTSCGLLRFFFFLCVLRLRAHLWDVGDLQNTLRMQRDDVLLR